MEEITAPIEPPKGSDHATAPVLLKKADVKSAPLSFTKTMTLEEAQQLDAEKVPYKAVVQVKTEKGEVGYQHLMEKDNEGVGLDGYGKESVDGVMKALETSDIVALVGPTRSGKTEAVLIGDDSVFATQTISRADSVLGIKKGYFIGV